MLFEVWAPNARAVELVAGDRRYPMAPRERGWHGVDAPVATGSDYSFSLDGASPRADPRSPWQPHGVHGPSRVVDHDTFQWTDDGWRAPPLAGAVVYELHVGTFTPEGTFDAVEQKLDHLGRLGASVVELMPVAEFPGRRGWGYDGVCLWAPHSAYGGPDGLKRLVDGCHRRGLAVALDVVYNHVGPCGNYLGEFGPYFTDRYATPWGEAVNLDGAGSDEVREFFIANALMWLRDYHIDGLRLDAMHAIVDLSATHFLEELTERVEALGAELARPLFVIAESDLNDPRLVQSREAGGYGADAQWNDDFHHALHAVLTGERSGYYADFGSIAHLAKALRAAFVYDGCYSRYRRRRHGRAALGLPGSRFVAYLQNHDQVGNRAIGERSSALMSPGKLKVGAALLLTAPYVPMLFQGEEWGAASPFQYFTDHDDAELAGAVSEGRRAEFAEFADFGTGDVPDPQDPATFDRSKLDWTELDADVHRDILEWHRTLLGLRGSHAALTSGRLQAVDVRFDDEGAWIVVERDSIAVVCNLSTTPISLPSPRHDARVLAASDPRCRLEPGWVVLPAESVLIVG